MTTTTWMAGILMAGSLFASITWAQEASPPKKLRRIEANNTTLLNDVNLFSVVEHQSGRANGPAPNQWWITRGKKLVAAYHADLRGTPGMYPLLSPAGRALTRNFPMADAGEYEKNDHDHHRSFWFTHGIVNDDDFWLDDPGPHTGNIVQQSLGFSSDGRTATVTSENDWNDPEGKRVLQDVRQFRFSEAQGDTVIDIDIHLIGSDEDVVFGDTKEGSLGIRVAGTMKVDAKLGGEVHNAEGLQDKKAWGKPSAWVDYSGPVDPQIVKDASNPVAADQSEGSPKDWPKAGITMMYHPENSIKECYWHVRTYGLFAANPFGRHHFGQPEYDGVTIKAGETLDLHFRVVLHDDGFDEAKSKAHFEAYTKKRVKKD